MGVDCSACVNPENDMRFNQDLRKKPKVRYIFDENNNEDTISSPENKKKK